MTIETICNLLQIPGEMVSCKTIKSGHINDTYKVSFVFEGVERFYILQRVNTYVFKHPEYIMKNISGVTEHIRAKIKATGRTAKRNVLHYLYAADGRNYYIDNENGFWRGYRFIEQSVSYDASDNLAVLEATGHAFGDFQMYLSDFDAESLLVTIPDFHNTPKRLETLFTHAEQARSSMIAEISEELAFFRERIELAGKLQKLHEEGKIPLRATHNDTKCNNVLFDEATNEALTVIDLDTVMPGLVMWDFGDAVRFAANSAVEDEPDLSAVSLDMARYEAFTKGFISRCGSILNKTELENMALGAIVITMELASRFLDDYLTGDKYFKTDYPGHNLIRARCQIALAKDMEAKFDQMNEIVQRYCK